MAEPQQPTGFTLAPAIETAAKTLLTKLVADTGREVRPQQADMVVAVEKAIKDRAHLLVQAGTGTGKSLGYLIPAIASGKAIVVSTATKQLGEQLADEMPALKKAIKAAGGPDIDYALLKGRRNYVCQNEVAVLQGLDAATANQDVAMLDVSQSATVAGVERPTAEDLVKLNSLLEWAEDTKTGDRTDAPAVTDKVWNQVSVDSFGCPGASECNFGETCFTELARKKAAASRLVITNHAQVAHDLQNSPDASDSQGLLGGWEVLIADEVHELENYLSSAWGMELSPAAVKHDVGLLMRKLPRDEKVDSARETGQKLVDDLAALADMLGEIDPGLLPELPQAPKDLMVSISGKIATLAAAADSATRIPGLHDEARTAAKSAVGGFEELHRVVETLTTDPDGYVRWLEGPRGNRGAVLKNAPLRVGPQLMAYLGSRTFVGTSATITVNGSFGPAVHALALDESVMAPAKPGDKPQPRAYASTNVGTPFDYEKQSYLYVPSAAFPAPVGPDRADHTAAVLEELATLVTAAGGRTLALFTTRRGADVAAAHLATVLNTPVLCQGQAPPAALVRAFAADPATTLCATMGFWQGVDVPGESLSLVVLDKIPFTPMNDPLSSARRTKADESGGNGFNEVFVNGAAINMAQGVGRLIRTSTDRGVIAVLDTRLFTKGYGRTLIGSMPFMKFTRDRDTVVAALNRLTGTPPTTEESPATSQPTIPSSRPEPGKSRPAAPSARSTRALASQTRG